MDHGTTLVGTLGNLAEPRQADSFLLLLRGLAVRLGDESLGYKQGSWNIYRLSRQRNVWLFEPNARIAFVDGTQMRDQTRG